MNLSTISLATSVTRLTTLWLKQPICGLGLRSLLHHARKWSTWLVHNVDSVCTNQVWMVQYPLAPNHQVAINEYRNRLAFSLCLDISVCVVTVTSQIQCGLYHFIFVNVYISIRAHLSRPYSTHLPTHLVAVNQCRNRFVFSL